jgi:hypothetical protein
MSDDAGEFGKRGCNTPARARVDAEFVVASNATVPSDA